MIMPKSIPPMLIFAQRAVACTTIEELIDIKTAYKQKTVLHDQQILDLLTDEVAYRLTHNTNTGTLLDKLIEELETAVGDKPKTLPPNPIPSNG